MKWLGCAVLAVFLAAPAPVIAGELRLSIANGRVTLVAQDVTIKQILDEWSRVGQTQIVGAERLIGTPVTLELNDVAEGRALESLLRSASGYIAKPRTTTAGASVYDRIMIMPASKAPAVSAAPAPFQPRPQPQVVMPNIDDDNEPNPIVPPGAVLPQPPQQFPGQPPMQQPGQQPGQQPTLTRPGQLPAPPPVPGNPYQPNPYVQPGAVRPPGVPGAGGTGPGGGPGGDDR